jgi:hypothetical protein
MPKKAKQKSTPSPQPLVFAAFFQTQRGKLLVISSFVGLALLLAAFTRYESYTSLYDYDAE